jgi:hypothetical protein
MQKQQESESIQRLIRQTRITFHDLHDTKSTQLSGLRKEASIEYHAKAKSALVDLAAESNAAYEANLPSLPDMASDGLFKSTQPVVSIKAKPRRNVGSAMKIANPLANLSVIDEEESSQHQVPSSPRTSAVISSSSTNNSEQASSHKATQFSRSDEHRNGNERLKEVENFSQTGTLQQKRLKANERELPSSESDTSSHSNESLSSSTSSLASSSSFFLSEKSCDKSVSLNQIYF